MILPAAHGGLDGLLHVQQPGVLCFQAAIREGIGELTVIEREFCLIIFSIQYDKLIFSEIERWLAGLVSTSIEIILGNLSKIMLKIEFYIETKIRKESCRARL